MRKNRLLTGARPLPMGTAAPPVVWRTPAQSAPWRTARCLAAIAMTARPIAAITMRTAFAPADVRHIHPPSDITATAATTAE